MFEIFIIYKNAKSTFIHQCFLSLSKRFQTFLLTYHSNVASYMVLIGM